jgi:hypothetical protein
MTEADTYLVWSNEHRGWWMQGGWGYSPDLRRAGRYSREHALDICREAMPTAAHIGLISEIPVRLADVEEFLSGQKVPAAIMGTT